METGTDSVRRLPWAATVAAGVGFVATAIFASVSRPIDPTFMKEPVLRVVAGLVALAGGGGAVLAGTRLVTRSRAAMAVALTVVLATPALLLLRHDLTGQAIVPSHEHHHDAGHLGSRERDVLTENLTKVRQRVVTMPTLADATAAGYTFATPFIPGQGVHYVKLGEVGMPIDPSRPTLLMFDGDQPHARTLGAGFLSTDAKRPLHVFPGSDYGWHRHFGLCLSDAFAVVGAMDNGSCEGGGGVRAGGLEGWMIHTWVVPGWESPAGVFSFSNPLAALHPERKAAEARILEAES